MAKRGTHRKIKTAGDMRRLWEEFKAECDGHRIMITEFSQKLGDFVSREVTKPITYTIGGFALFCGVDRSNFYATYDNDNAAEFRSVINCIRAECELDARRKFEAGAIPSQLSGLWMSKYGYGAPADNKSESADVVDDWVKGVVADGEAD